MKTKNKLMTGAALGASAIALLIASTGVAQAHNAGNGGGPGSSLVADGTLTEVQATAVRDAMRASKEVQKDAAIAALMRWRQPKEIVAPCVLSSLTEPSRRRKFKNSVLP
jgi:hypothetical protein